MNRQKGQVTTSLMTVGILALIVGGIIGWSIKSSNAQTPLPQIGQKQEVNLINLPQVKLNQDMRKLWEDHITWTRMYLISAAYNNGDTDQAAARLMKNQEDIGNAVKAYYGEDAGNKLTTLLKEHITLAVDIVQAAKVNDSQALDTANSKWYDNANQIADFLASANPNWSKDDLRRMMKDHLDLTKQEAVDILGKKYEESVTDYDKVHAEIIMMSDTLSDGIIKQFPDKF